MALLKDLTTEFTDLALSTPTRLKKSFDEIFSLPKRVYDRIATTPERLKDFPQLALDSLTDNTGVNLAKRAYKGLESSYRTAFSEQLESKREEEIAKQRKKTPVEIGVAGLPKTYLSQRTTEPKTLEETASPTESAFASGMAGAQTFSGFAGGSGPQKRILDTLTTAGKQKLLNELSSEVTDMGVKKILTEIGYEKTIIPKITRLLTQAKSPQKVEAILNGFENARPIYLYEKAKREANVLSKIPKYLQNEEAELTARKFQLEEMRRARPEVNIPQRPGLETLDDLIAKGDIRVKSEGGKDVFEYRKGENWFRARDESSAISQVSPRPSKKIQLPEELEMAKLDIAQRKEGLGYDPARGLSKYANRNQELPEVTGEGKSIFRRQGDSIVTEYGFEDSETARQAYENYVRRKAGIQMDETAIKNEVNRYIQEEKAYREAEKSYRKDFQEFIKKVKAERANKLSNTTDTLIDEANFDRALIEEEYNTLKPDSNIFSGNVEDIYTVLSKTYTPYKNRVNFIDRYMSTPKYVFDKIGLRPVYDKVKKGYEAYVKELPENLEKISKWASSLPKESNVKIFRYLDGKGGELTEQELKVANEVKGWLNEWAERLKLSPEKRITNYITHIFPNAPDEPIPDEVMRVLSENAPEGVKNPFLKSRFGNKVGYLEDTWNALEAYVKVGTRKVHMDEPLETLGSLEGKVEASIWDYIKDFSDKVNLRPTKKEIELDNFIKSYIGEKLGSRPTEKTLGFLRRATSLARLGFSIPSALKNLTQGVNTFTELGGKWTTLGYHDLMRNGGKELVENNVIQDAFILDRAEQRAIKKFWYNVDRAAFYNFELTEKINRGAAYYGAKAKALSEGKSLEEAIEIGKEIAEKTQFKFSSIDTPVGLNNSLAKTLLQFQTYNVKQIEFITRMAKEKKLAPLIRYITASSVVFGGIGQAFGMGMKDIFPTIRLLDGYIPPAVEFPYTLGKEVLSGKDDYGRKQTPQKRLQNVAKSFLKTEVPAGTQIKRSLEGAKIMAEGGKRDSRGRYLYRVAKTPVNYARAVLFGPYNLSEAKDYYEREPKKPLETDSSGMPVYDLNMGETLEASSELVDYDLNAL